MYRRPVALTSLLALGMAAAIAGVSTLTSEATAFNDHTSASAAAPSSSPAPSASASPSPSSAPTTDSKEVVSSGGSSDNTSVLVAPAALGTTATAPSTPESNRVGALFSGSISAGNHFCTASVLHSSTKNLILTAAHCVSGTDGVKFVPGYRDGKAPYGSWQVTKVYTTTGWSTDTDEDEDFAILQVARDDGRDIEDVVGGNTLGLKASYTTVVRLYGVPDDSESPILCTNVTTRQDTNQRRIDCPSYSGGTSGGPWIDTGTGQVIGVIGGYQEGGNTDDTSYSAYFDSTIGTLYKQAVADS
ncbi:trypsin-like serine peptidase [Kitasatospora atroaurantiaca]|nr:serine protease [Kitasatospora atroaurantiaca]